MLILSSVFACVIIFGRGNFLRWANAATITLSVTCLLGSLYLERWVFDKETNRFEQHWGLVFAHSTKVRPLDALRTVVVEESAESSRARPGGKLLARRSAVLLYLRDQQGGVHRLNVAGRADVPEVRKTAERLSAFLQIPLEEHIHRHSTRFPQT